MSPDSDTLALYAVSALNSRGRQHAVEPSHDRNPFQRDYTRILHSRAFRRLQGKTQVFSAADGDMFRTRMSHSLEVEQLSRSIARQLRLNEDLCAALAIGHDIGHPPFGHMGQDVINGMMKGHGGFEHNHQALRLVDELEGCYPEHLGLNLLFETREGLLKHCSPARARTLGDVAVRHLDGTSPPLEVQVVDHADAIAYLHADLEDAMVRGILSAQDVRDAPGFMAAWERTASKMRYRDLKLPENEDLSDQAHPETQRMGRATLQAVIREMMSTAMNDLIVCSRAALVEAQPASLDEVRQSPPLIGFSPEHLARHKALRKFSRERIYDHPEVSRVRQVQAQALRELFCAFVQDPSQMSGRRWVSDGTSKADVHRAVADHIAGMTDHFALAEHARLRLEAPHLLAPLAVMETPPVRRSRAMP